MGQPMPPQRNQNQGQKEGAAQPAPATGDDVLARAQQGDNRALEAVFESFKGVVRAKSRSYFLVGADSEDLIQEGMIGLYKAIRDFRGDKHSSFCAFADMCITRQIITAIKSATRLKHMPLNSYVSLNKAVFGEVAEKTFMEIMRETAVADPEDVIISREQRIGFEAKVSELLSSLEKSVLTLYLDGETYCGIAERVGKDVKSIDNALQRVKRKLEKFLENGALG